MVRAEVVFYRKRRSRLSVGEYVTHTEFLPISMSKSS